MTQSILAAIHSQPWAIMPGYLEAIEAIAMRFLDHPAVTAVAEDGHVERHAAAIAQMGERVGGTKTAALRDGVGCLPMFGPILPRASMISPSGAGAVALDQAAADLRVLQAEKSVKRILITSDSPGGAVTDVAAFARLVAQSEKPITVHVTGMCCSAMYWIASQAREISADETAIVGSLGVMMGGKVQENPDASGNRDVAIVSSNAPNKRPDLSSEEGRAAIRTMVDQLESIFIETVARGRGVTTAKVIADFGRGGTMTGSHAKSAGMIDRVEANGLDGAIRRLSARAPATPRRTAAANHLAIAQLRAGL